MASLIFTRMKENESEKVSSIWKFSIFFFKELVYPSKNFKIKFKDKGLVIPAIIWDKTNGIHIL